MSNVREWSFSPAVCANVFATRNPDVVGSDAVALIRKTSDISGKKIWCVVQSGDGVNCSFDDVAKATDWWEDSFDEAKS